MVSTPDFAESNPCIKRKPREEVATITDMRFVMEFLNLLGRAFSPWGGGEGGDTPVNFG